ncbi:MAG: hypothetical protein ABJD07_01410, partial [Gemmatimonadaceae bacterium]
MTEHGERVFILGAGRAGQGLARALRASAVEVVGVHGRHALPGAEAVTAGLIPPPVSRATIVLVTVRDAQLGAALRELACSSFAPTCVVLHASGGASPPELDELRASGHPAGTFHPLVPFVDPSLATERLRSAWIGIDGDAPALRASRRLAAALGARTIEIPKGEKARYH